MPNMDLLIDSTAGSAMFSFMDGFSGYNQIRMAPKDVEKTAFRTPMGNFYYTVMPFGLKNAGATYQRAMTAIFHDMMQQELENYVDDIVVKSKKREEHFYVLRKVFKRCRAFKLRMNPLKCAFGMSSEKFLGFLVHNRGIDVDPTKATVIATMWLPVTVKELKSFLGKVSLIAQENRGGVEQPVYYISRALKDAKTRYPRAKRACLAIVYASQRLRYYFMAYKVWLMTKSHAIKALLQQPILSGRITQ